MSDLRKAAQAVVDRWDTPLWKDAPHTGTFIDALRAALEQPEPESVRRVQKQFMDEEVFYTVPPKPEQEPLTEDEIELAYQEVWRSLPSDFSYTSYNWIEQGIRYAERKHGIGV